MEINKITAGVRGSTNPSTGSTGKEMADTINKLVDYVMNSEYGNKVLKAKTDQALASRGKIIRFSQYVTDPMNRASVDEAVRQVNALMTEESTVDLTGSYVWPTVSFNTGQNKHVQYLGGNFIRKDNIGTEYLIWLLGQDSAVLYGRYDGRSIGINNWGQQCIYVPGGINGRVMGNIFHDVGDAPIRYARNVTSGPSPQTDGFIISDNIFVNCTQVTSNNAGAGNVLITNNIFRNSGLKITQRNTTFVGHTLVKGNIWCNMTDARLNFSCQGSGDVVVEDNIAEVTAGFIGAYPNRDYWNESLKNKGIKVRNNTFMVTGKLDAPYTLGYYKSGYLQDGVTPLPHEGHHLTFNNNTIYCDLPGTDTLLMFSAPTTENEDLPGFHTLKVKDNTVHGQVHDFVRIHRNLFHEQCSVQVEDNDVVCTGTLVTTKDCRYRHGSKLRISDNKGKVKKLFDPERDKYTGTADNTGNNLTLTIKDNELEFDSYGDVEYNNFIALNMFFVAKTFIYTDNTFICDEMYRGAVLNITVSRSLADRPTLWVMHNNNVIKPKANPEGVGEPASIWINGDGGAGVPFDVISASNNKYIGHVRKPAGGSRSSGVPDMRQLHWTTDDIINDCNLVFNERTGKNTSSEQQVREYSDGSVLLQGNATSSTDPIMLPYASASEFYQVQITPDHLTGTPVTHSVKRSKAGFQVYMYTLAGDPITSLGYTYTCEYYFDPAERTEPVV